MLARRAKSYSIPLQSQGFHLTVILRSARPSTLGSLSTTCDALATLFGASSPGADADIGGTIASDVKGDEALLV